MASQNHNGPDVKQLSDLICMKRAVSAVYDIPADEGLLNTLFPKAVEPVGCPYVASWGTKILEGTPLVFKPTNHKLCFGWMSNIFGEKRGTLESLGKFLCDVEGIKETPESAIQWTKTQAPSSSKNGWLVIAPYNCESPAFQFLQTVTFWVTPDQLSSLHTAAAFLQKDTEPEPITSPFGSDCKNMFPNPLNVTPGVPHGCIGLLDSTHRAFLPDRNLLTLSVNVALLERLVATASNPKSSLHKVPSEAIYGRTSQQQIKAAVPYLDLS